MKIPNTGARGFTIIEVTIATALFAAVIVTSLDVMDSSTRTTGRVMTTSDMRIRERIALNQIVKDLQSSSAQQIFCPTPGSNPLAYTTPLTPANSPQAAISFKVCTGSVPSPAPAGLVAGDPVYEANARVYELDTVTDPANADPRSPTIWFTPPQPVPAAGTKKLRTALVNHVMRPSTVLGSDPAALEPFDAAPGVPAPSATDPVALQRPNVLGFSVSIDANNEVTVTITCVVHDPYQPDAWGPFSGLARGKLVHPRLVVTETAKVIPWNAN